MGSIFKSLLGSIYKNIARIYTCVIIIMALVFVLGIIFSVIYLLNKVGVLSDEDMASFTEIDGSSSSLDANADFLEVARWCHEQVRTLGFTYGHDGTMPFDESAVTHIDCSQYVSWALNEYGYDLTVQPCSTGDLVKWCNNNLDPVWDGYTYYVSEIEDDIGEQIQAGDIVIIGYEYEKGGEVSEHTQIFAGYASDGTQIWYNCGSDGSIAKVEGEDKYNVGNTTFADRDSNGKVIVGKEKGFLYVYRVPSLE